MKIQLINPAIGPQYLEMTFAKCYQPFGLIIIANTLYDRFGNSFDIEVLDGAITSNHEIAQRINADIVGISCNVFNYEAALSFANIAKNNGARIILGGPHATVMRGRILANRKQIDHIIIRDGEAAMADLLSGRPESCIPNLIWRDNDTIKTNICKGSHISDRAFQSRDWLDLETYSDNFHKYNSHFPFGRTIQIQSQRGCSHRSTNRACVYCARIEEGWELRKPADVWNEIKELVRAYNIDFVWDISDSFTSSPLWLRDLAACRPPNFKTSFLIFARPDELDEERIDLISEIGCHAVILGAESGDDEILKRINKGINLNDTYKAAKYLGKKGIFLYLCFVLGLPGESIKSLENTFSFAQEIEQLCPIKSMVANTLMPLPGTMAFDMLMTKTRFRKRYYGEDIFCVRDLQEEWANNYCDVNYNILNNYSELFVRRFDNVNFIGKYKKDKKDL